MLVSLPTLSAVRWSLPPPNNGIRRSSVLRWTIRILGVYLLLSALVGAINTVQVIRLFDVDLSTPYGINAVYVFFIESGKVVLAGLFLLGRRWAVWGLLLLPITVRLLVPIVGYGFGIEWLEMSAVAALLALLFVYDPQALLPMPKHRVRESK